MIFKSLISKSEFDYKEDIEKKYIKLLAFGISDFREANKIWEKLQERNSNLDNNQMNPLDLDLMVYEHLSQNKISPDQFGAKQILSLTYQELQAEEAQALRLSSVQALESLDKIFPQKMNVSSMTPSPLHFGPLEGFFSDSNSDIDIKTLILTIGFWFSVYTLIIYYLYF